MKLKNKSTTGAERQETGLLPVVEGNRPAWSSFACENGKIWSDSRQSWVYYEIG
jgi:hypothetical protein